MNDRYLYRAKRKDNGEWVEGFYFCMEHTDCRHTHHFIMPLGTDLSLGTPIEKIQVEVDPSTICQCTGLKKLFEKDIVKRTDIHKVGEPSIGIIEYDVENTAFVIHWIDKEKYSPMYPWKDKIKVICNIFDNPELLEVGE